jgi:hypothetical protein
MASAADMEIQVTGDVGGGVTALKTVQAELGKTVVSAKAADVSFQNLGNETSALQKTTTSLGKTTNSLGLTMAQSRAAYNTNSAALAELSDVHVNAAGKLSKTSVALEHLTSIDDIAAHSIRSFGRELLHMIPYLAFSGTVALITTAFTALADILEGTTKAEKRLNEAMAEGESSVAGEIAQMESLISIAKNTNLSYAVRTQAVKELNKEYPELNGNITLENINTVGVTGAINNQIEAIKTRSKAKAIEKLIDDETSKVEKLKLNGPSFFGGLPAQVTDFVGDISRQLGAPGLIGTQDAFHKAFVDPIKEGEANIDIFAKQLLALNTNLATSGKLFVPPKPPKEKKAKEDTDLKAALSLQQKLIEENAKIGMSARDADLRDAQQKFDENIKILKKGGLSVVAETINYQEAVRVINDKYDKEANSEFNKIIEDHLKDIKKWNDDILKEQKKTSDALLHEDEKGLENILKNYKISDDEKLKQIKTDLAKDLKVFKDNLDAKKISLEEYNNDTKTLEEKAQAETESIQKKGFEMQQNFYANLASAAAKGLGDIATGAGTLSSAFSSVLKVFGEYLIKLGEAAIAQAILVKAAKKVWVNPVAGLAAGIAAIVVGEILTTIKLPAFATGVRDFGGGVAMVGERGPELVSLPQHSSVTPNAQLRSMGSSNVFIPNVTIKGSDLVLVFNRQQQRNSRNG